MNNQLCKLNKKWYYQNEPYLTTLQELIESFTDHKLSKQEFVTTAYQYSSKRTHQHIDYEFVSKYE